MASHRRNVIVSILFVVFGGPGILLVYLPLWISHFRIPSSEPMGLKIAAAALVIAGLVPLIESIRRFISKGRGTLMPTVPTERLVVSGLYRYVRNPMYVGVVTALLGETILFWNRGLVIESVLVFLGANLFVLLYEEPSLMRRYPEEYSLYKRNVPRWLPRLTPSENNQT
jgi:protein-S-isoprenylcysteine O-methyltransferase Ste14